MFTMYNERTKYPIRIWLQDESKIEESCLEQAYNLANLPFIHKWVSLMPDTHTGKGMPIGGVIATEGVIIPNAVGVDIGCGMIFVPTNIKVEELLEVTTGNGPLVQAIVGDILRNIPVGYNRHKSKKSSAVLDKANEQFDLYKDNEELVPLIDDGYYQVGTLGGGNHFIELQRDQDGYLGIMIHSGSRHLGKEICDYFHNKARELNSRWYSAVPDSFHLAFLPVDTKEGKQYINWMNLALDYAYENRASMLDNTCNIVATWIKKYIGKDIEFGEIINCHHNYASYETHYGKDVWVHRKGATRTRKGEIAVIPGAMGSYSYVVEGLGNEMSFESSSHGAGRAYSRKKAIETFPVEKVILDLREQGVAIAKHKKSDIAEECRFAYKNIDEVMENQRDLVKPIRKLETVGVVKG
ncbi:RtcB family protein [Anaerosporobacter sp.]|uniref:RtcB family protein n=1 Tax=Anaerosporobacter sp. TaxID=1872529 RepID=UPI00286EE049|nr:RtcB family protein [Anaerosporobacter sp.]